MKALRRNDFPGSLVSSSPAGREGVSGAAGRGGPHAIGRMRRDATAAERAVYQPAETRLQRFARPGLTL